MIFNDFQSIFNSFERRDGAAGVSGSHPGVSGSFGELRGAFRDPVRPCGAQKGRSYMGGARFCEGFGMQLCPSRVHRDLLSPMKNIDLSSQIPPVDRDLFGSVFPYNSANFFGGPRSLEWTETIDSDDTERWRTYPT